MGKHLNVVVLVDEWTVPAGDPDMLKQPEKPMTEYHVTATLRDIGHTVSVVPATKDTAGMVSVLKQREPDLVFNLTETIDGDRLMDKNIASLIELMQIPFTGTGPAGLLLCRDKRLCKELLSRHKIRVPAFLSLPIGKKVRVPRSVKFPLVVKPAFEDGSEGISNASLVNNENALLERVQYVHESWGQPVIAEEYVEGRELYVGVIGNSQLKVLPIRECKFESDEEGGPQLATYNVKHNEKYRRKWKVDFGFADLDDDTIRRLARTCKKIYRIMQLRDYGRIDLRLTPEGRLVILEVNPNPDIAYGEEVAEAAEKAGMGYEELIDRLVKLALKRYR